MWQTLTAQEQQRKGDERKQPKTEEEKTCGLVAARPGTVCEEGGNQSSASGVQDFVVSLGFSNRRAGNIFGI